MSFLNLPNISSIMHCLLQTFRKNSNFIPDCCKIGDNKFLRNNKKHSETAEKPSLLFVFVNFILLSRRNFKIPSKTLSCAIQRSIKEGQMSIKFTARQLSAGLLLRKVSIKSI